MPHTLSIAELKARLKKEKLGNRTGNFIRLETDKPIVVHVLPRLDSLWFRQIATHWMGTKKIYCANPTQDEEGSCYICDMIKHEEEVLEDAKREHADDNPKEAAEHAAIFAAVEESLDKIKPRRLFAFNVVVRTDGSAEEIAKTIEAPWNLFQGIYNMFNSAVQDYEVDITDPRSSTPFTLKRTGQGKTGTRYSATAAPKSLPIYSGPKGQPLPEDVFQAKIEALLEKALDLDEHYKLPTEQELIAAWKEFCPEEGTDKEPAPAPKPAPKPAPPSMSRIGKPPQQPVVNHKFGPKPEPEEEPDELPGLENQNSSTPEPASVPASKSEANAASLKLLTRLKKGNK